MTTGDVSREFDNTIFTRYQGETLGKVAKATAIAYEAHEGQFRRNGQPYIVHPLRVALVLMREFCCYNVDMVCAAILHDVVEDAGDRFSLEKLKDEFGEGVSNLVDAVSYVNEREPDHVRFAKKAQKVHDGGRRAVLLKLSDRIDNLRDLANLSSKDARDVRFREAYLSETEEHYIPMANSPRNPEALAAILKEVDRYKQ